jgi:AAA domain-containing protein
MITFRPAVRENVSLILGLIGASGSGKTFTAMRLAQGIAGEKAFAVIDTEAGRALHYADRFHFDHADLKSPFRPDAYADAIKQADEAGYPAIVVDSFSHEHAGDGGLLDWHEEELERLARGDEARRERVKMTAWIKPKGAHRKMIQRLLQVRAHLILCFRAEDKIEMVKKGGEMVIQPKQTLAGFKGWVPICEKNLPYELTASFMLMPDKPGYPQPIKLEAQHRELFPLDQPIDENSGRRLADWARGGDRHGANTPAVDSITGGGASGSEHTPMDRGLMKAQIKGAADKAGMPDKVRLTLAKNLLGGGTIETADESSVQDLLDAVRKWTP